MSELEEVLAYQLRVYNIPFEREFIIPGRRFRWDFKLDDPSRLSNGILVEVQGGVWIKAAHSTGTGVTSDCEKLNFATLNGYRLLNFTGDMVNDGAAIQTICKLLDIAY